MWIPRLKRTLQRYISRSFTRETTPATVPTTRSHTPRNTTLSICEFLPSTLSEALARSLHIIEQQDTTDSRANFVTALNAVLVWSGARTATFPTWEYCDPSCVIEFITNINQLCQQHLPASAGKIDELIILPRPQIYRDGSVVQQEFIIRRNCPRVRITRDPPVSDSEIGRELDMYPGNADNFAAADDLAPNAFSIWEVDADILLFAEVWWPDRLSLCQRRGFLRHCQKTVSRWSSAMERMSLVYRVYGTMDRCGSEVPFAKAKKTMQYFGKAFIGTDCRAKEYSAHVNKNNKLY